jgi:hypothetical protein
LGAVYHPGLQRFLSEDPLRFSREAMLSLVARREGARDAFDAGE